MDVPQVKKKSTEYYRIFQNHSPYKNRIESYMMQKYKMIHTILLYTTTVYVQKMQYYVFTYSSIFLLWYKFKYIMKLKWNLRSTGSNIWGLHSMWTNDNTNSIKSTVTFTVLNMLSWLHSNSARMILQTFWMVERQHTIRLEMRSY